MEDRHRYKSNLYNYHKINHKAHFKVIQNYNIWLMFKVMSDDSGLSIYTSWLPRGGSEQVI